MVEDPHHDGIVAGCLGDGNGLLGQRLPAVERAAVGEFRAQGGQHQRPVRVVGGKQFQRHLQRLDLFPVRGTDGAVEAAVVGQAGSHQPVDIADSGGPPCRVEKRDPERRVARLPL